jgi:hypothetical protein
MGGVVIIDRKMPINEADKKRLDGSATKFEGFKWSFKQ